MRIRAILVALLLAAAPAEAQETDTLRLAAARELVTLTSAGEQALRVMEANLPAQREAMPQVPPEFWDRFLKRARESRGELEVALAGLYARHFSTEEIRQLIAFYGTPLGMKLLERQPFIARESVQVGQDWGRRLGTRVGEEMLAEAGAPKP